MQKDHLPDHAFWRFIMKTHETDLAHKILQPLQAISTLQINLLLFCCWFAQAGQGRLNKQDVQALIVATASWHDRIILPLQKLQSQIIALQLNDLADTIADELQYAEHIEQLMLIDVPVKFTRTSRTPSQKLNDACKNIAVYCKTAHIFLSNASCENIFHLLATVFPRIDLNELRKTCQAILLSEAAQPASQGRLILD